MAMKVDPARSAAAKAGWEKRRCRMAHEANCNLAISRGIAARNDAYKHKREIADEVMSIQDDIYEVSMFCAYEIHKIIQETPIKHLRRKYNASLWKRFRASFVYSMLYVSAEAFHRQQIVSMDIEDYRKECELEGWDYNGASDAQVDLLQMYENRFLSVSQIMN